MAVSQRALSSGKKVKVGHGASEVVSGEGGREDVGAQLPPYLISTNSSQGEGWTLGHLHVYRTEKIRNEHRKQAR